MEHPEADAQSHRRQAGAQGHVSGEEHRKAKNPQHQQGNPPVRHKGHPQATEDTLSSPEAQDHRIIMTHRDQDASQHSPLHEIAIGLQKEGPQVRGQQGLPQVHQNHQTGLGNAVASHIIGHAGISAAVGADIVPVQEAGHGHRAI